MVISETRKAEIAAYTAGVVESAISEIKSSDPEVRALAEEIIRAIPHTGAPVDVVLHDLDPEALAEGMIKNRKETER